MKSDAILIVGDSMLDRYWQGAVERISPEAPVPVLRLGREWQRPGGAANVAVNLRALGAKAALATLLGDDEAADTLAQMLEAEGVALHALRCAATPTTQKIRAVCQQHQLLRIDIEQAFAAASARALAERVCTLLPHHHWLVLSDYAKGSLAEGPALIAHAHTHGARVLVDPKGTDFGRYRGAWLLKPNEREAAAATGAWRDEAGFRTRMQALRRELEIEHLLVTRGERGMALFSAGRMPLMVPACEPREVYDVSGAGDTALAALVASLAAGRGVDDAVRRANVAAGIAVGKFGTATVSRDEWEAAQPLGIAA